MLTIWSALGSTQDSACPAFALNCNITADQFMLQNGDLCLSYSFKLCFSLYFFKILFCFVLLQNHCSFYQTRFWIRKFCAFLKKNKAFSLSYPQWCNVWLTPFGIWLMLSELADLLQNILWKLSKYPESTMLLFSYNEIVKVFVSEKLHKNQHTKEWG